jgi:hypothetical protein
MTLAEGTLVGPYRLRRLLGRGGMAVVYEAAHESTGRVVALKLVAPDLTDPGFVERFHREGRMQAALEHPHVLTVYEAGTSEHGPYLAMQLVDGTTLAGLIEDGALSADRALHLLGQVADALDAAHAAGLVHRDVKPRNVLVGAGDHAYLADFGLTRTSDADGATATGHFMGTLAYVAPEVVRGDPAGPAADRYGLAAVLFECLTATPVFPRPTQAAVLYAHTHSPPPRASGRRDGIPPAVDEVLIAGLAKDPADRPKRAVELVSRVRAALGGVELGPPAPRMLPEGDDATTTGEAAVPAHGAPRRRGSRRGLAVAAVVGALAGAGVVALLDDDPVSTRASEPTTPFPVPEGMKRLGSDLSRPGRTRDCRDQPVGPQSPNCTVFQGRLAGALLVTPRHGVVRRWGLRSARGEFALVVMRRRDEGYFQISRSRNEFASNGGPFVFETNLRVEPGDRLGLQVAGGSAAGMRASPGAQTGRVIPQVTGLIRPAESGPGEELLMFADYEPGARRDVPGRLGGAAAAAAPDGKIVERRRAKFQNGQQAEVQVVMTQGRGALDAFVDGRRVGRAPIPELQRPIQPGMQLIVVPEGPAQVAVYIAFNNLYSDRLNHHYFVVRHKRLVSLD